MLKSFVCGNVGKSPEVRATQDGRDFASFSVAVSVGTKAEPKTVWVDITCNGKLVDVAKNYIKKGTKVLIEGFPSISTYTNKENKTVASLKVTAHSIELLGNTAKESSDGASIENGILRSSSLESEVPF